MRRPPYLPFLSGPLGLAPGLKPIPEETWLQPDTEAHAIPAKRALMRARRDEVFAAMPGSAGVASQAAAAIGPHAGPGEGDFGSDLESAASTVSDDVCVLSIGEGGRWCLVAASVCAPTFWTLGEKIGRPLDALHGPVPGANPGMVSRIDRIFHGLGPGQVLERFNWTVQPGPDRFTPDQAPFKALAATLPESGALDALWLRVERQAIVKLPGSGAVVFTIRVAVDPLRSALPDAAHVAAFRSAWETIDPVLADYKGWPHYERLVRAALAEAI